MAVGALGTITGALLVARARRRLGFGVAWTVAVAVCGLAFAGMGWARVVPVVAALSAAFLACVAVAGTCSMSLRQEVTPEPLLAGSPPPSGPCTTQRPRSARPSSPGRRGTRARPRSAWPPAPAAY